MSDPRIFDEPVGLLKKGTIVGYNAQRGTIQVRLANTTAIKGNSFLPIDVPAPHSLFYNNGIYVGSLPQYGTPVVVGQGSGGQYYFVSFLAENLQTVPNLQLGKLLIQSNDLTKINLSLDNDINIGSDYNKIHINSKDNLITVNFNNSNQFTQASRSVNGTVKRDLRFNEKYSQSNKLDSDIYNSQLIEIGLDPSVTTNKNIAGSSKNPAFVEKRELIYEFQYDSDVDNDYNESLLYNNHNLSVNKNYIYPNRRISRSDTLSLTLLSPNYLMESIKGTVVDIFGNILDLNRTPIPVGKDQFTLRDEKEPNKSQTFLKIKELERKSLAFHFEINARKNLNNSGEVVLPDINSKTNYSRDRSRFFVDIDKEGQFKINIPASSETGNVPLTTRYENYSSFGTEDDNNPNKLFPREDNLDIFLDSFAAPKSTPSATGFDFSKESGSILLKDNLGEAAPIDRITSFHIKHGSVYHDLLQTCYVHQNNDFLNYQAGTSRVTNVDLSLITPIKNIVSDTINVSGPNSNAGGRSGSITLDGSVELNIGANTVDRQSLWLDTAGGIVANIGRDLQNKSAAISMNGDFYLQVGGFGVSGDTRFAKQNNGTIGAVLDLRVMTDGGYVHMVRCDKNGITIMTPGNLAVHSHGNMKFTSDSDIEIDAESVIIQARLVLKELGGSI